MSGDNGIYTEQFRVDLQNAVRVARSDLGRSFRERGLEANRAKAYYEISGALLREAQRMEDRGITSVFQGQTYDRLVKAARLLQSQAEITTGSGDEGAGAILGNLNAMIRAAGTGRYEVGLEEFSWEIVDATVQFFEAIANRGDSNAFDQIDVNNQKAVDGTVWQARGLIRYFPGIALEIDYGAVDEESLVWNTTYTQNNALVQPSLTDRHFGPTDYLRFGGGAQVLSAFSNPLFRTLGNDPSNYGFNVNALPTEAGSTLISPNGRNRFVIDEFGRRRIENVDTGQYVWTEDGNDYVGLLNRFGAFGFGRLFYPTWLEPWADIDIEVSPTFASAYNATWQIDEESGLLIHGADRLKDYTGFGYGVGGTRVRHNPGDFFDDSQSTLLSVDAYQRRFGQSALGGVAQFSQTQDLPDGGFERKDFTIVVEGDVTRVSYTSYTYSDGVIESGAQATAEISSDDAISVSAATEEDGTALLNILQDPRVQEQIDAAASMAENARDGGLTSLGVEDVPITIGNIPQLAFDLDRLSLGITIYTEPTLEFVEFDPRTGTRLPSNVRLKRLSDGSFEDGFFDKRGRTLELVYDVTEDGIPLNAAGEPVLDSEGKFRTDIEDTTPIVVETRISDGKGDNGKGGVTVVQSISRNSQKPVSTDIEINGNPFGIDFSDIGGALGRQLGYRLAGDDKLAGIVSSSLLSTLGDSLGDTLDGIVGNQSIGRALDDAYDTFGPELLANLKAAGIGALSSFLTAELINAIGVDGFAGELLNTGASAIVGEIFTNIVNGAAPLANVNAIATIGSAVGSLIGSKLANEVISFDTIGGQIGSAVGSSLGVLGVTTLAVAGTGSSATLLGVQLGAFAGPVGALIGAFAGFIVGGLIGSVFGGTPRSGADVAWDEEEGRYVTASVYSRKGGSKDAAKALASSVAETFNAVLDATGGMLANPTAVTAGNYGMRKSDFVYRPTSTRDKSAITYRVDSADENAFDKITGYGIFRGLTDSDFQIIGGSNYIKRAVYATVETGGMNATNFDQSVLLGNIVTAQFYETYLSNNILIGAITGGEGDSVFAAETAINLTRAVELGLTKRHRADWFGGFSALSDEAGVSVAEIDFGFDYDPFNEKVSRLIGLGNFVLEDSIDTGGQTVITTGADESDSNVIDLRTGGLGDQTGFVINGVLRNDIASSDVDFSSASEVSAAIASNELRAKAQLSAAADSTVEDAEQFRVVLSDGTGSYLQRGTANITIVGEDESAHLMVGRSYSAEGDGHLVWRVSLSKAALSGVAISLSLSEGGAEADADYFDTIEVSADGTSNWVSASQLTLAAGVTEYYVRVAVRADNTLNANFDPYEFDANGLIIPGSGNGEAEFQNIEGNEHVTLQATVVTGAEYLANGDQTIAGIGTIVDGATIDPLVWADDLIIHEGQTADLSIARSRATASASNFAYDTKDNRALEIPVAATVDAGGGDDTVHASDLGDNVFGGAGNDTLYGGQLDDWLLGGEGDDRLDAGAENGGLGGDGNYLNGGAGDDQLFGREGSDWLEGGDGVDILRAGDGGDILSGGAGEGDELYGGAGNDTYLLRRGDGADVAEDDDALAIEAGTPTTVLNETGNSTLIDAIASRILAIRAGDTKRDWLGTSTAVSAGQTAGGDDSIAFGYGITLSDVRLSRSDDGDDLIVEITTIGDDGTEIPTGDKLIIRDWFADPFKRVEWLKFVDGTEIRIGDVTSFIVGTVGDDVLIGTEGNDFVYGGAGNDKLYTLGGNDIGLGGTGDDFVSGGADDDIVVGGLGDDQVIGGSGNDALTGDAGNDSLYGSQGVDILAGGRGNDIMVGGAGDDRFRFARGDGHDIVFDDYSDDWTVVWQDGEWQNEYAFDPATGEVLDPEGNVVRKNFGTVEEPDFQWVGQFDYDDTTGELRQFTPPGGATTLVSDKGEDTIEFALDINVQDIMFERQAGSNDLRVVIGRNNAETSLASARDSLTLQDWYGAPGSIETFAFFATGEIDVSATGYNLIAGTDSAEGGFDMPLRGTLTADWMTGAGGDDHLAGGSGDDIVAGNAGNDRLKGEAGNDVLYGGSGDDILDGGLGADILSGGAGLDAASYASSSNAVTVYLSNADLNMGDAAGDTYDSIENLIGSGAGDVLGGDDGDNEITGGKGSDFLLGGLGSDTYVWNIGDGADVIEDVEFIAETIVSAEGEIGKNYEVLWTQVGDPKGGNQKTEFELQLVHSDTGELIYGDRVFTYDGLNDQPEVRFWRKQGWEKGFLPATDGSVTRVAYDEQMDAGEADAIEMGAGISLSDLFFEREGNDLRISYIVNDDGNNGDGLAVGQSNNANLLVRNHFLEKNRVEYLIFADGLTVDLANVLTADSSGVVNGSDLDELIVGQRGVRNDVLSGGAGDDVISGGEGDDQLSGGDGDDVLEGGIGADAIDGGAHSPAPADGTTSSGLRGDTVRYATSGAGVTVDLASAGPQSGGNAQGDTLTGIENVTGSVHDDSLSGDDNDNVLDALGGNNTLLGRGGDDVLVSGDGADTLDGGAGEDNLSAGGGDDILRGGADNDVLAGLDGDDQLFGDGGDDILSAGSGNDRLEGGLGNDELIAGEGNDTLLGGAGADTLVGEAGDDSLAGGADADSYFFAVGFGQDVLTDSEGANEILIDQSISYDSLWFHRSGDDLVMSVRGADDTLTISDFFAASNAANIYSVQTATHRLFLGHPEVRNFLDTMQATGPAGAPAEIPAEVAAIMERYWHEGTAARPYAEDFDLAIDEDTTTGLVAIGAIDHDENISSYEITGDALNGTASVDESGRFSYAPDLNFNGEDSFTVAVIDADGNGREIEVRVAIAPVDDAPVIDGVEGGQPLAVDENALLSDTANGNQIGRILASEFDGEAVVFSLTDNAGDRFTISADGVVGVANAAALDHEAAESHTITVLVTDAVGSTDERSFEITIGDVNEENALPVAYGWDIAENSAAGTVVGQVVATDPDTTGETFAEQRYAFEHNGELQQVSADGRYAINALTGVVTVAAPGDFEAVEPTRDYIVVARDNAGHPGYTESRTTLTIGITDVNEANSFEGNAALELAENESAGKLVGIVSADDPDTTGSQFASQRYYFWDGTTASSTSADGRFAIDAATGAVTATASYDYESDVQAADYTVVARDNGGEAPYFSAFQTVSIALTNVNETPNVPVLQSALEFIGEGSASGSVVANFALYDPDGTVPSLIADGNPGDLFEIVGGEIRLAATVDFETLAALGYAIGDVDGDGRADITVNLTVHATDGELRSVHADTLTFHVEDVNEAPSELLTTNFAASFGERDRVPIGTALPAITLAELSVDDPDLAGLANAQYTFTVDDARFEVVGNELRLREGVAFDHENEAQVTVTVTGTDGGVDPLSISRELTFAVDDADDHLEGTPDADTLVGQANRDIISGFSGDDRIEGLTGDDVLIGNDGDDTILGGAGSDDIQGGADDDMLFGGAGADTISGSSGHDTISGGADGDAIDAGDGDDTILGDDDGAVDTIDGGAGIDRLDYSTLDRAVTADLSAGIADGDAVVNVEEVAGTGLADTLTGDDGDNRLIGGAGADTLDGLGGSDRLEGGADGDAISGGDGDDLLFGEAGDDSLTGDAGSDSLFGGEGVDTLLGGAGDDRLEGGAGDDVLDAGDGNDTYIVDRRSDHDTIFNYDQLGTDIDVLGFSDAFGEITEHDLWFERQGDDLVVFVIGEETSVRVTNWYTEVDADGRANHRLDFLLGGDWVSRDTDVEGLAEFQSGFPRPSTVQELEALTSDSAYDATVATFFGINAPPEITGIADQRILEDGRMEIVLTLADDYTPAAGIALSGGVTSGADLLGPQGLVIGAVGSDGTVTVTLEPAAHVAGTIGLAFTATDAGGIENTQAIELVVDPVADAPVITQLSANQGTSGAAIALSLAVEFPDQDGSENQSVRIAGIPDGVALNRGSLDNASGDWILAPTDLAELAILAPAGWSEDLTLQATAFASEGGATAQSETVSTKLVINAPPTDILSGLAVAENAASGSVIGLLQGVDPDGDQLTFKLLDSAEGRFSVDTDGLLRVADGSKLDYEGATSHAIRVRVSDTSGETFERSVTVEVTDVNEANALPQAHSVSVSEDRPAGTTVGTVTASDPDDGGSTFGQQRYSFRSGSTLSQTSADGLFSIDALTGVITTAVAIDHETTAAVTYTVVARDDAGGPDANETSTSISIAIGDVNEANDLPAALSFSVVENGGIGASVGSVVASDPDAANEAFGEQRYYFLVDGNASANSRDGRFAIDAITGEITTTRALDHESSDASTTHTIVSRDNRGAAGYNVTQAQVTISVANVNEAPVVSGDTSAIVFAEPLTAGTVVASFAASDPDGTTPILQLTGGAELFEVDGNDVVLKDGAPATFADALAYANARGISAGDVDGDGKADIRLGTVEVVASDGSLTSGPIRRDIYVENVSENPDAPVVVSNGSFSETGDGLTPHAGQVVATFDLSDPDGSTPALVITSGNDNGWFEVAGNSIVFAPNVDLTADYLRSILGTSGVAASFAGDLDGDGLKELLVAELTVAARDADGLLSSATNVEVRIEDRNEGPEFSASAYSGEVAEISEAYTKVGVVSAADIDGSASELLFAFAGGTVRADTHLGVDIGVSADGKLLIDRRTGVIYTAGTDIFDGQGDQDLAYDVTVTDRMGDVHSLSQNTTFELSITPVDVAHSLIEGLDGGFEEEVSVPVGTEVIDLGDVMLDDPENGHNIRWRFADGSNQQGIWILNETGQLYLEDPGIDYEALTTETTVDFEWVGGEPIEVETKNRNYDLAKFNLEIEAYNIVTGDTATATYKAEVYDRDEAPELSSSTAVSKGSGKVVKLESTVFAIENDTTEGDIVRLRFDDPDTLSTSDPLSYRIENLVKTKYNVTSGGHDGIGHTDPTIAISSDGTISFEAPGDGEWEGGIKLAGGGKETLDYHYTFDVVVRDATGTESRTEFTIIFGRNGKDFGPVVLDFDGDGVEFISLYESEVFKDLDGDGIADRTGWVSADDGIVVLDRDGSGLIDNPDEMTFIGDYEGAKSDMEGLRGFDTNQDGVFDAKDERFQDFQVWRDFDQDGVSDVGELFTFAEMGVTSISLTTTLTGDKPGDWKDNGVYALGTFTRSDGSTGTAGDTWLYYEPSIDVDLAAPVILDFDGDGEALVGLDASTTLFDQDGDGELERTAWFGSGDGVLAIDRNENGVIDDISEISFLQDLEGAKTDLEGLAAYDINVDGVIDANDIDFAALKVWFDRDSDGVTDAGELVSLSEAGVSAISLTAAQDETTGVQTDGSMIYGKATFVFDDGREGVLFDTGLAYLSDDATHSTDVAGSPAAEVQFASSGLSFERKSKKYRAYSMNGELAIGMKKPKSVADLRAGTTGAFTELTFSNRDYGYLNTIVLDLDNDGIEHRRFSKSRARFDMNGDGVRDDTGWTTSRDGFLIVDRNENGRVDDGSELSFVLDAPNARNAMQGLAAFDSNNDGLVSVLDERFGELKVWVDADKDGVSDAGEVRSLAEHGIASISLRAAANQAREKVGRNVLLSTAVFNRTDGSTGSIGDVAMGYKPSAKPVSTDFDTSGRRLELLDEYGMPRIDELSLEDILRDDFFRRFEGQVGSEDPVDVWLRRNGDGQLELPQMPDAREPVGVLPEEVQEPIEVDGEALPEVVDAERERLFAQLMQDMAAFGGKNGLDDQLRDRNQPYSLTDFYG